MVTKEVLMKENAAIFEELHVSTRELLEQYRPVFEQALDILINEEVLSGEQFRSLLAKFQTKKTSA
jgi:ATP-dependent Zn protease